MAFGRDSVLSLRPRQPRRQVWRLMLILILLAMAFPAFIEQAVEQVVEPPPAQAQLAWTQIWNEEFNGAGRIDTSKWIYDIGHGYPGGPANWGTGEIAYHTDSTANVNQAGGSLAITPRRDGAGNWTSGRIETVRTDFNAPAGGALAVEGRIQHPNVGGAAAQGYWPAFWMLGGGYRADRWSWPRIGEIDLLETVNGQDMVISTLHCGTSPGGPCNETSGISSGPKPCVGCRTSYHNYRMEYDRSRSPEQLRFYLDGGLYHTINQNQAPADVWSNALHHGGFHIILNVAMGGGWPGNPTASTQPGVPMLIDWVRVYRATPCSGCPTPVPPTAVPSTPYLGSPVSLPGTIQAENFDRGGAGVAFNETTPGNTGGYNYRTDGANDVDIANNCGVCVNYIAPGEWLRYAVSVANAGTYTFNFRHAGGGGGTFHLETTSGQQLTGPIFQQATASWDTYVTYSQQVNLPAGSYGIILKFDSCPNCNLNNVDWFSFTGGPTGPTATRTRTNTSIGGATATRTRTRTRTYTPGGPTLTRTRTRTNTSSIAPSPTTPSGSTTWAPGTWYAIGARVTYAGLTYQCIQAHTAQVGWEPPNVPALWSRV